MEAIFWILAVVAVWYALGWGIVRENERGVKVVLGNPSGIVESGPRWIPWLFGKLRRYTTKLFELGGEPEKNGTSAEGAAKQREFARAGVLTKAGKSADPDDTEVYSPVNVGIDVSLRYYWPSDSTRLIDVVKSLPDPDDRKALANIFEELVLEQVRTVGSQRTWIDLYRDRAKFAADITLAITTNLSPTNILLKVDSPVVVIDHLEFPEGLINSISKAEIARLEKKAKIIDADAEKEVLTRQGEGNEAKKTAEGRGDANARKSLYEAIGSEPQNIQKEVLLTLREMAKGTSNTILFQIPSQITDTLSEIFGKSKGLGPEQIMKDLSQEQLKNLLTWIEAKLREGGSK
jgi:regulator of protease activity HflC (stomatin/prohibitin superfamily)